MVKVFPLRSSTVLDPQALIPIAEPSQRENYQDRDVVEGTVEYVPPVAVELCYGCHRRTKMLLTY